MSEEPRSQPGEALEVLRAVWRAEGSADPSRDDGDVPVKVCKNMKNVGFDDMADDGDLRAAWRATLARDGKLNRASSTVHDLVLGGPDSSR